MNKRELAIKCFVFALSEVGHCRVERRKGWMLRGLHLWQEATGQDVSRNLAEVRKWGSTNFAGLVRAESESK